MPATYTDFDLLIVPGVEHYTARVIDSPAGQATTEFRPVVGAGELRYFWQRTGYRMRHLVASGANDTDPPGLDPQTFGARLYDAVFAGAVGEVFRRSLDAARRRGQGLRIRLRLNDAPELADLPWEFMYSTALARFLALSDETPVVRYVELADPERALAVAPPLRILAVVANPRNVEPLNVEQEWRHLETAVRDLQARDQVILERLAQPTLAGLQTRLRQGDVHLLHFIGHGYYDQQAGQGGLVFEDASGGRQTVAAPQLGALLHDHRSLRLVFLNACEGARSGATLPFAGVAQKLVRQGIPAVLAMQFVISDPAALALAREFYSALADGLPVDAATSEARKAVYAAGESFEWGTPVLFSRAPDGAILHAAPATEGPMPEPMPEPADVAGAAAAQPWWNQIQAGGDVIIATIGAGSSNVAVGKHITQQIGQLFGPPTPDDKQIVEQELDRLAAGLGAGDMVTQQMAGLQLQLLRGELTKTEEGATPSASAIQLAGNWLLEHVPGAREALARLFATPAVARVLAKAGDVALTWVGERFGAA